MSTPSAPPAPIPPAIVVLAAGRGSRYGQAPKLVEPLDRRSVLGTTIGHAIASGLPLVVVAGDEALAEARRWVRDADVVHLPDAAASDRRGMGWSIAAGVAARPRAAGWLVLPGDMPLVRASSLQAVALALGEHVIACAHHRGRRGHPVGFAAELFSELVRLEGDEGAKRLLARYPSHPVELADEGVVQDIDTPDDLARARRALRERDAA